MSMKLKSTLIAVSLVEKTKTHIEYASLQMSFDQMYIASHQCQAASSNTLEWMDLHNPPTLHLENTCNSVSHSYSKEKITRSKLLRDEDGIASESSEHEELDQCIN